MIWECAISFQTKGTADGTAGASAARLVLAELPSALAEVGGSADGRAMLEAPLRTLLTPSCGP